ncbi:hypothetical protein GW17_00004998 [Ensete ventricosum]|nr:hypothetical protein GW17_00004998 [Ensete ventricosum]
MSTVTPPITMPAAVAAAASLVLFAPSRSSSSSPRILRRPSLLPLRRANAAPSRSRIPRLVAVRAAVAIEKETPEEERPETFLRAADGHHGAASSSASVRARFERMIREVQDEVCAAIEAADGGGKFKEDVWSRPGGGGGISRVLQDGGVWEKAGVNVSVVYGVMPPEAYRAAKGEAASGNGNSSVKAGPVPFFAAGISSVCVLHPKNPFGPTLHFNYRYFETDAPKDAPGAPRQWWFGGGTDFTPAYIFEEDVKHFHRVQKETCDKFDPSFYPRFKKWCDDYFFIKRSSFRGVIGSTRPDVGDEEERLDSAIGFRTTRSGHRLHFPSDAFTSVPTLQGSHNNNLCNPPPSHACLSELATFTTHTQPQEEHAVNSRQQQPQATSKGAALEGFDGDAAEWEGGVWAQLGKRPCAA